MHTDSLPCMARAARKFPPSANKPRFIRHLIESIGCPGHSDSFGSAAARWGRKHLRRCRKLQRTIPQAMKPTAMCCHVLILYEISSRQILDTCNRLPASHFKSKCRQIAAISSDACKEIDPL